MGKVKMVICQNCSSATPKKEQYCVQCGRYAPDIPASLNLSLSIFLFIAITVLAFYGYLWIAGILLILLITGIHHCWKIHKTSRATPPPPNPPKQNKTGKANGIVKFQDNLSVIWAGDAIDIEFSYRDRDGTRTRRNITLEEVLIDTSGMAYLFGFCHLREEDRHFKIDRVSSKIKAGPKRYDISDFFREKLNFDDTLIARVAEAHF